MLHRQVVVTEALIHISADENENDRFVKGKPVDCGDGRIIFGQRTLTYLTEALVHISSDEKENDRFVEGKQLLCRRYLWSDKPYLTETLVHIFADERENDRFVGDKQLLCGGLL
jgi:hypothetical protein